ncbi:MAG: hypothetical protein Q4E13_05955 [Clostridia bacterium]|nr:hypothetical protein [Clostridia bacterium]
MKRFVRAILEWKTAVALSYTGCIVIYMAIAALCGETAMALRTGVGLLALCMAGSAIQLVCFTQNVFRHLRYSMRLLLFAALFLPVVGICAVRMHWFPLENPWAWLTFCAIFLAIFAVMTIGFELYFRIAGRRYDGLLGQYRRQREEER